MLNEIQNKYEQFSDSIILKFEYFTRGASKEIIVTIDCMNKLNDYKYETIKLSFNDVISFRFIENENEASVSINEALLIKENGVLTFDFFPLRLGASTLKENKDSDLIIRCKDVSYVKIERVSL
ncbi:hypothetical protein DVR12_04345 [Chitinophaga silvatica]|uniref:Immunity protein 50 n=1 Tax=Chitinophaga silvatica TaxID=2282649 RepID=A0A3E1YDV5_9BACT|nr:hypothetical protein [Chitinophaga silvatica]RFS24447.1 hypothetical protein DVR12_04345 [Chitinophaga silvatica]